MDGGILYALGLTLIAGGATGIGAALVLFLDRKCTKILSAALGFSAGVMIYVSMIEIFAKGRIYLQSAVGENMGDIYITAAFFGGIVIIGIIDWFLPSAEGDIGNLGKDSEKSLSRMGIMTAVAIAIHNFPEGVVTFTSALKSPMLGVAICTAIAIHNIPEGIATAVPIFYAGGGRLKAFAISCFSGITEPVGALAGYLVLRPILSDFTFGIIFGIVSGIMVFISIEELLPMAREYDNGRLTIVGFVLGMSVMALSLLMFGK